MDEVHCDEVLNQLSEYVDEEARAELCRAIEAHLARCRGCKIEVDIQEAMFHAILAEQQKAARP